MQEGVLEFYKANSTSGSSSHPSGERDSKHFRAPSIRAQRLLLKEPGKCSSVPAPLGSVEEKDLIKSQRLRQRARPGASFMIYGSAVENSEGWSSEVTVETKPKFEPKKCSPWSIGWTFRKCMLNNTSSGVGVQTSDFGRRKLALFYTPNNALY